MKHTQGEWKVINPDVPSMQIVETPHHYLKVKVGDKKAINLGTSSMDDYEEWEANAKLIAAAPELLFACRQALGIVDYIDPALEHNVKKIVKQIDAAIKKATE